ncbi:MAG TPA: class I SAM-dependent methyltransferase [Candidatus Sulfotelmatobacter sp.]
MSYVERIVPGQPEWKAYIAGHRHRYRFAAQSVRGSRVLDAGCGVGYGSRMLVDAGAEEVVAVDISDTALDQARQYFAHPRVSFVQDDCETLSRVTGSFDTIVAFESMEHFHEAGKFLERAAHLMSPNGVFICSVPNSLVFLPAGDGRPLNPFHVHEYAPDEFRKLLSRHFEAVTVMAQHFTAAYVLAKQAALLWSNPFFRAGSLIQRLWGHKLRWNPPVPECTESDYVMREDELDSAEVLVGVCRGSLLRSDQSTQSTDLEEPAVPLKR